MLKHRADYKEVFARTPLTRERRRSPLSRVSSRAFLPIALLVLATRCPAETAAPLPDAPQPQADQSTQAHAGQTVGQGRDNTVFSVHVGPAYPAVADKWDSIINPGQRAQPLRGGGKLLYAVHEQVQPIVLGPALLSAAWGQLTDSNPHAGVDAGGFGVRFGESLLRQATDRITGDGFYAAVFRQDPRFYREGTGPYVHRGLRAVRQTFLRRSDNGADRVNLSGILGHATGNYLAIAYYPHVSATVGVATAGFATSIAADMGSRLIQEFGPDLLYRVFRHNQ